MTRLRRTGGSDFDSRHARPVFRRPLRPQGSFRAERLGSATISPARMPLPVSRRTFLQLAGGAAAYSSACGVRSYVAPAVRTRRPFARVLVSPDRVIRTRSRTSAVSRVRLRPSRGTDGREAARPRLRARRGRRHALVGDGALAVGELSGWTGAADRCARDRLRRGRTRDGAAAAETRRSRHDLREGCSAEHHVEHGGRAVGPVQRVRRGRTSPAFDDQFARAARLSWRLFQDLPCATTASAGSRTSAIGRAPPPPGKPDLYPTPSISARAIIRFRRVTPGASRRC